MCGHFRYPFRYLVSVNHLRCTTNTRLHRRRITRGVSPVRSTNGLSGISAIVRTDLKILLVSKHLPNNKNKGMTNIILRVNKVPPILTAECILQRLTCRVIPTSIAGIEICVFRPRHIHLGVIIVLDTIRILCIAGVDLICCEGVLNITPGQVVIATVS